MQPINDHCNVVRGENGIAQLTICNAGPLNIMNSAVIRGVREGLEFLARDTSIRVLVVRGSGEKSMIGGADIKEMATLDQASAEKFITGLRDLCEAVRQFPTPVIARLRGWCLGGGLEFAAALRSAHRVAGCKVRDARGQGRHPLCHPCGVVAAVDRLGTRPLG